MVVSANPPQISTLRKSAPAAKRKKTKAPVAAGIAKKKRGKAAEAKGATIDMWAVLDAGGGNGSRNSSVGAIATRMFPKLAPFFSRLKQLQGEVVIELQPPVALQKFHYVMHELHGMALGFGLRVRLQQAKRKERAVPGGATSRSTNYDTRKAGAIEDCKTWLSGQLDTTSDDDGEIQDWIKWFVSNKKQDDAADALLHAAVALSTPRCNAVLGIDVGITHLGVCILRSS